jgi:hypothetical protein
VKVGEMILSVYKDFGGRGGYTVVAEVYAGREIEGQQVSDPTYINTRTRQEAIQRAQDFLTTHAENWSAFK